MDIIELRKNFSVAIIAPTSPMEELSNHLRSTGFQITDYDSSVSCLELIQDNPPHILLFDVNSLDISISELLEKITSISDEILNITWGSTADFRQSKKCFLFGLYDFLIASEDIGDQITLTLDKACEHLYYLYQNEQLLEQVNSPKAKSEDTSLPIIQNSHPLEERVLTEFVDALELAPDSTQSIEIFLAHLQKKSEGNLRAVYFEFNPILYTLIARTSIGVTSEVKGLGLKLQGNEALQHKEVLTILEGYDRFRTLMHQALKADKFRSIPHIIMGEVCGIFVLWRTDQRDILQNYSELDFTLFRINYERKLYQEKLHHLEINDEVTGLYNLAYFQKVLESEFNRAQRLKLPLSVVRASIDRYDTFKATFGPENANILLKSVGIIIKETSRLTDISARTSESEISFILTHISRKGAGIRAERIRKMTEQADFKLLKIDPTFKVTMSFGISEYPTLARDAADLIRTADTALLQVKKAGGNKVGIIKPPKDHNPDFLVSDF